MEIYYLITPSLCHKNFRIGQLDGLLRTLSTFTTRDTELALAPTVERDVPSVVAAWPRGLDIC